MKTTEFWLHEALKIYEDIKMKNGAETHAEFLIKNTIRQIQIEALEYAAEVIHNHATENFGSTIAEQEIFDKIKELEKC